MAFPGHKAILEVLDTTMKPVAAVQGLDMNWANDVIEAGSRDDELWKRVFQGPRGASISGDGLLVFSDEGQAKLVNAAMVGDGSVDVRITEPGGLAFRASCQIASLPMSFGYDGGATYQFEFRVDGKPTKIWEVDP